MRGGGARKTKRRNIKRDSPVAGAYTYWNNSVRIFRVTISHVPPGFLVAVYLCGLVCLELLVCLSFRFVVLGVVSVLVFHLVFRLSLALCCFRLALSAWASRPGRPSHSSVLLLALVFGLCFCGVSLPLLFFLLPLAAALFLFSSSARVALLR